jgi:hypothetical protein
MVNRKRPTVPRLLGIAVMVERTSPANPSAVRQR